jgi:hypothetical protein
MNHLVVTVTAHKKAITWNPLAKMMDVIFSDLGEEFKDNRGKFLDELLV